MQSVRWFCSLVPHPGLLQGRISKSSLSFRHLSSTLPFFFNFCIFLFTLLRSLFRESGINSSGRGHWSQLLFFKIQSVCFPRRLTRCCCSSLELVCLFWCSLFGGGCPRHHGVARQRTAQRTASDRCLRAHVARALHQRDVIAAQRRRCHGNQGRRV